MLGMFLEMAGKLIKEQFFLMEEIQKNYGTDD